MEFDKPKNLDELIDLQSFRTKAAMYIGEKKISVLAGFFNGWDFCLNCHEIKEQRLSPVSREFSDFVAKHFGWFESTAGWKNIILKESEGDEAKAVEEFFELYDEYRKKSLFKQN